METDEIIWRKQFAALASAVEPHTFEVDGDQLIGGTCQPAVARSYDRMLQVGYAKGWV